MLHQQRKRTASDTYLAFEYQWDFFVLEVLQLLEKEIVVSFEFLEDIAKQKNDDVILYQVKHSVRKKSDGKTINLTNRDNDLWKTISVWMSFIEENRESERPRYIENNQFVLVTNKSGDNNSFMEALSEYKQNRDIIKFKEAIVAIINSGAMESEITTLMKKFVGAPYLERFVQQIDVNLTPNELESVIKEKIGLRFALKKTKIDLVYERLMTKMRDDAKNDIRNRIVVQYTCYTIQERYWDIIQEGRDKLVFRTDYPCYSGNPCDLMFIKQLMSVNDIGEKDYDDIVNYTNEWFQFYNNFKDQWNRHDINERDVKNLTSDVNTVWRNSHKQNYKRLSETSSITDLEDAANTMLVSIRQVSLSIANTPIGQTLSNGCFYYYSNDDSTIIPDMPRIGWHINWEDKFKKNE